MHANLHRIQELAVLGVKEWVELHKKIPFVPEVFVTLATAEKPLTRAEIAIRARLDPAAIEPMIAFLEKEGLLRTFHGDLPLHEQPLEISGDADRTLHSLFIGHTEEAMGILEPRLAEARNLLESCRGQFDAFDWLFAKNLSLRLKKLEFFIQVLKRHSKLWELIDGHEHPAPQEIKAVPVR